MLNLMIHQPFLFDFEVYATDHGTKEAAGKSVARKLNQMRRALSPREIEFDYFLARAVREVKTIAALSEDKKVDLVLTVIETCAHTVQEIMDDSHLSQSAVKDILETLTEQNQIESVKRLTVGGSANQMLIFSKRKPCSCV